MKVTYTSAANVNIVRDVLSQSWTTDPSHPVPSTYCIHYAEYKNSATFTVSVVCPLMKDLSQSTDISVP